MAEEKKKKKKTLFGKIVKSMQNSMSDTAMGTQSARASGLTNDKAVRADSGNTGMSAYDRPTSSTNSASSSRITTRKRDK